MMGETARMDPYGRLGAAAEEEGVYVRFDPGFGLNVVIGHRTHRISGTREKEDRDALTLGIDGWEMLCDLAVAYREREAALPRCEHGTKTHLFCHLCPRVGGDEEVGDGNG